jgi:hypothetical protein
MIDRIGFREEISSFTRLDHIGNSINTGGIRNLVDLLPAINKTWTRRGLRPKVSEDSSS